MKQLYLAALLLTAGMLDARNLINDPECGNPASGEVMLSEGVKQGKLGAGAWIYFFGKEEGGMPLPRVKIQGTNPWHRVCCEFTAPARTGENGYAPVLGLWVWNAKGTAWFDEIRLEELP